MALTVKHCPLWQFLRKTRVAFRLAVLLTVVVLLLLAAKGGIEKRIMSLYDSKPVLTEDTILDTVQSLDGSSTAHVFQNGIVHVKTKGNESFPNYTRLASLTQENLENAYEDLLLNVTAECFVNPSIQKLSANGITKRKQRKRESSHPDLCIVGRFQPRHPCFCFSFGSTGNIEFEQELASSTKCQVFVFNQNMKQDSQMRSERLLLFKQGLSDTFVKGDAKSAPNDNIFGYLTRFKAQDVAIDVLKMELGEREWMVLRRAVADGSLKNVKQLVLTIRQDNSATENELRNRIQVLMHLFNAGFRRWHPSGVTKASLSNASLSYVNARCILQDGPCSFRNPSRTSLTVPLDTLVISDAPQHSRLEAVKQAVLSATTAVQREMLYFDLIRQQHLFCPLNRRIGNAGDGGWDVCFTDPFDISKSKPCIAYSFGINYVWKYDDVLADVYNCRVYMFDPSMTKEKDHKRRKTSWFYRTGLSANNSVESNGWKMRTLCSLFDELGHSEGTIDLLKTDIEYWEWSAFETALKDGCLTRVKQLMFESHTDGLFRKKSDYARYIRILIGLFDLGFRTWRWHMNPASVFQESDSKVKRACCYEHYLLNILFLRKKV